MLYNLYGLMVLLGLIVIKENLNLDSNFSPLMCFKEEEEEENLSSMMMMMLFIVYS